MTEIFGARMIATAAAVLALGVSACGGDSGTATTATTVLPPPESAPSPSATTSTTTEPSPTTSAATTAPASPTTVATPQTTVDAPVFAAGYRYTDGDGFKWEYGLSVGSLPTFEKILDNMPPGQASFEMVGDPDGFVWINNLLSDRAATAGDGLPSVVYALYDTGGICNRVGVEFRGVTYCDVPIGAVAALNFVEVPASGSVTIELTYERDIRLPLDEAAVDEALKVLAEPPAYVIVELLGVRSLVNGDLAPCDPDFGAVPGYHGFWSWDGTPFQCAVLPA